MSLNLLAELTSYDIYLCASRQYDPSKFEGETSEVRLVKFDKSRKS